METEGQAAVFGAYGVPGACGDGDEVGGDQRGGGGFPVAVAEVFGDAVGEDGPAFGGGDGELEDGLEVGLVEGGEDALDVFHEELGVEVGLAVGGVGEAVHALPGAGVAHGGVDAQFVLAGGESLEGEPVLVEGRGVEGPAVQGDGAQFGGLHLDEGVRVGAGGEPDDGQGVEGLVPSGQVEFDPVVVDVEELGTGLRFVARQYGHEAMLPDGAGQDTGVVRYMRIDATWSRAAVRGAGGVAGAAERRAAAVTPVYRPGRLRRSWWPRRSWRCRRSGRSCRPWRSCRRPRRPRCARGAG